MEPYVVYTTAYKEIFIKYVYFWDLTDIQKEGILQSPDGFLGAAIYCTKVTDIENRMRVIRDLVEKMDWRKVEGLNSDRTDEEILNFIYPVFFEYSGPYFHKNERPVPLTSLPNIGIQTKNIDCKKVVIGLPIHFR
ncbi:hypothetical protein [Paenibacillus tepidiphilus]|uniref:hypothetical protein n=1 Tax=Paenibacillus tepidiphilus TaxID=2608683 RepID=UPI0012399E64|nr:hypothetical protein [Paenibacillus tepidiphilus]